MYATALLLAIIIGLGLGLWAAALYAIYFTFGWAGIFLYALVCVLGALLSQTLKQILIEEGELN